MINMPCPKCGSPNTELRNSPPFTKDNFSWKNLLYFIAAELKKAGPYPKGPKYLVCKDCNHRILIHFN